MPRTFEKDPRKLVQHGKHIFMFWNVNTHQVLYSFFPGLEKAHLKQLPFIGKKSVPADIRPDFWKPFCTVTFPTTHQGLIAYRKLREFRRLHETAWDKTQPQLLQLPRKLRIKALMAQKANSVADLAKVLAIQKQQEGWMKENIVDMTRKQKEYLHKKWADIEALAKAANDGEVSRLEPDIERLKEALPRKNSEKEKERVTKAIRLLSHRLGKLKWAQRMVSSRDNAERRWRLKNGEQYGAPEAIKSESSEEVTPQTEEFLIDPAESTEAPTKTIPESVRTNLNNQITISVLPKHLQKQPTEPFTLEGVSIEWADLYDAEYAKSWPEAVVHDTMGAVRRLPPVPNQERIAFPIFEPVAIAKAAAEAEAKIVGAKEEERVQEEKKMGLLKWAWEKKNPFRIASLHEQPKTT